VIQSTAGEPGKMTVGELPEMTESLSVYVNDKRVEVPRFANVNKVLQSGYYEICEGDQVEILNYYTVEQIVEFMDVVLEPSMKLYVNNKLADKDTPVYENFSVVWTEGEMAEYAGEAEGTDSFDEAEEETEETVETAMQPVDGKQEEVPRTISVIVNKQPIALTGKSRYVYVDVFECIDFDLSRPRGKGIVTTLNGRPAEYMEPINDGDVIEIYWRS